MSGTVIDFPNKRPVDNSAELQQCNRYFHQEQAMTQPTTAADKPLTHEEAWSLLFKALAVLMAEAKKPTFHTQAFKDPDGRTWAMPALVRHADRQFNFLRARGGNRA